MPSEWSRDAFAKLIGVSFTLHSAENAKVEIELIEVSELKETARQRSFSIVFKAPDGHRIGQGLYDVTEPTLGSMEIFLVPIDAQGRTVEAVFNQLKPA